MNIPTDVLRTCTKTNKQTQLSLSLSLPLALSLSLSLALSRCLASSALWTISFSSFKSRQDNCRLPLFFISHFKTTQLFFSYFLDTAFFFFLILFAPYFYDTSSVERVSVLRRTNSLATSSLVLWESILMMVRPVSSMETLFIRG